MTHFLYLCRTRVLILGMHETGWTVCESFANTGADLMALSSWFESRKRRSINALIDVPYETLDMQILPKLSFLQRYFLINNLSRHFRQKHALSCHAESIVFPKREELRHFALNGTTEECFWYSMVYKMRKKIRSLYSAALLSEQFMLPEILPEADQSQVLLCAAIGDDAIRHSFFYNGRLCFIRTLDREQNAVVLFQQLSDTRRYLQEQFQSRQTASAASAVLKCCITMDLPDYKKSGFTVDQTTVYVIDRADVAPTSADQLTHHKPVHSHSGVDLSVSQLRLFDFVADKIISSGNKLPFKPCSLEWRVHKDWREFSLGILDSVSVHRTFRHAIAVLNFLLLIISIAMFLIALRYVWSVREQQLQNNRLQEQLSAAAARDIPSSVAPEIMRDVVLLNQALGEKIVSPFTLLSGLAKSTAESDRVVVQSIEWARRNSSREQGSELVPELRARLTLRDGRMIDVETTRIRVSGYFVRGELTLGQAYAEFQSYVESLVLMPGWELLAADQSPFDTAVRNYRRKDAHETKSRRPAEQIVDSFSLLFEHSAQQ